MQQEKPDSGNNNTPPSGMDKHWHLSTNDHEIALSEIEFSVFRTFAAFSRWMDDLAACCHVADPMCNGIDFSLLNVIRMHDRAKSISEVARLLNRDDISNLQYSIRKLTKAKLIEKVGSSGNKKGATYIATENGVNATNLYAKFRKELLMPLTTAISESEGQMDQVSRMLSLLAGMYDQAACVAASHRNS